VKFLSVVFAFVVLSMVTVMSAVAQDPVKVAPQAFKEKLNNDKVRVLEYTSKPGAKEAFHSHREMLLYVIQGGKFKSTTADGVSEIIDYRTGDVSWREAVSHSGENVGSTVLKTLLIEVKGTEK
jgi:quercetin dioxygenase-like cupin family protein